MGMTKAIEVNPAVAEKLISYGQKHPTAFDTAKGIAMWCIRMPLEEVLPALESLVELGKWEKLELYDRVLYRPVLNSHSGKEL